MVQVGSPSPRRKTRKGQEKPTGKRYLNTNRRNVNADISSVRAALDFSQGTPLQRRK